MHRRESERRAMDICSGNSVGLSNCRANNGLASSMTLHAAPNAGASPISSTCCSEIPSSRTHFRSRERLPVPCSLRNRPRQYARANAVRNGSRASSQNASGSILRIRSVSATPPAARPFVRADVVTWTVGQYRILASWREQRNQRLVLAKRDRRETSNPAISRPSYAKARAGDCGVMRPRLCSSDPGAKRVRRGAPCISHLPAGAKPARLRTQASPSPLRVSEPACELGAACVRLSECPNSRKGRSSPHLQGRVMDEPRRVTTCVGIDVSKDRLDVHVLPTGEAFAVARDGKGLESLVERLGTLEVPLIVLEATGGFETTVAAALASAGLPLAIVNPRQRRRSHCPVRRQDQAASSPGSEFGRQGAGRTRRPTAPPGCRDDRHGGQPSPPRRRQTARQDDRSPPRFPRKGTCRRRRRHRHGHTRLASLARSGRLALLSSRASAR